MAEKKLNVQAVLNKISIFISAKVFTKYLKKLSNQPDLNYFSGYLLQEKNMHILFIQSQIPAMTIDSSRFLLHIISEIYMHAQ